MRAYPNGELQFENLNDPLNANIDQEVSDINQRRFMARNLRPRKDEDITEKNLEKIIWHLYMTSVNI